MKLYIAIYLAGHLGGTVGPLPYGYDECKQRITEIVINADPSIITPDGYSLNDLVLRCEWHIKRPENEEVWK